MFRKTTLKNGLRLITLPMPGVKSATVLIGVGAGSRYESRQTNGLAHFMEHMAFKGTPKRPSSQAISTEIDGVGGEFNAFTDKEFTAYFVKLAAKHNELGFDLLSDMLQNPLLKTEEIDRERGVIIEEINMYEDTPMRRVIEDFIALLYGDNPMGWDIAGSKENIRRMKREDFVAYISRLYVPKNMVVAIAGKFDEEKVKLLAEKHNIQDIPGNINMGLFNYPILMASDILIYKASKVPVGIDQEPHLEVSREIARKMNETYGTDFPEPSRFATKGEYIPSLVGEGKMSKSVEGSFINLNDDLETIKKRLAAAPTDSGQGESVPSKGGVATLLKFVELFQGAGKRAEYEKAYTGDGIRYGDLKNGIAQAIFEELTPIQEKRKELEANPEYVDKVIRDGAQKAREVASQTLQEVKTAMGLGE